MELGIGAEDKEADDESEEEDDEEDEEDDVDWTSISGL